MSAKQALGRGLKALIPETPQARAGFAEIPVDRLQPNPQQPRHRFDDEALAELAESIRKHGVLQPILVSEDRPGRYLLITGERRWRAARLAGLATVPAVIREHLEGSAQLELALVRQTDPRADAETECVTFDTLRTNRNKGAAASTGKRRNRLVASGAGKPAARDRHAAGPAGRHRDDRAGGDGGGGRRRVGSVRGRGQPGSGRRRVRQARGRAC